jgi:hypothetical protein
MHLRHAEQALAAIDEKRLPGDEAAALRAKARDCGADVFLCAPMPA